MEAFTRNCMESPPSDRVMWRDKDPHGCPEHIFKIFPPLGDLLRQIIPAGEFPLAVPLVMMISVEHRFIATGCNTDAEPFNQLWIFVEWMNGPPATKFLWNSFTRPCSTERNDRQGNGPPFRHFSVSAFQFIRRSEKARIVVTNTEVHADSPMGSLGTMYCAIGKAELPRKRQAPQKALPGAIEPFFVFNSLT